MSLDYLCIFDDFARLLELGEPIVDLPGLVRVYDGKGLTYGHYISRVKRIFQMDFIRASVCDLSKPIERIGLPWGGLGLSNNARYMQKLVEQKCDLFIAGEVDDYGMQFAKDSGVAMIETGHEISENPGLIHFTEMLKKQFPTVETIFWEVHPAFTLQ